MLPEFFFRNVRDYEDGEVVMRRSGKVIHVVRYEVVFISDVRSKVGNEIDGIV